MLTALVVVGAWLAIDVVFVWVWGLVRRIDRPEDI